MAPTLPSVPLRAQLAVALATLFVIVGAGVIILGGGEETRAEAGGFAGAVRPPGIPPADFRLRDQDGRWVTLKQFRGQVVVVTFTNPPVSGKTYTSIPDLITGADMKPSLVACWQAYNAATHKDAMATLLTLRFETLQKASDSTA